MTALRESALRDRGSQLRRGWNRAARRSLPREYRTVAVLVLTTVLIVERSSAGPTWSRSPR